MKRAICVAVLVLSGCADSTPTAPPQPEEGVTLSLTVSRRTLPTSTFVFRVEAANYDSVILYRADGCSFWKTGLTLEFIAPDGSVSYPRDRIGGRCPDRMVEFLPGERLVATCEFTGTLYDSNGYPSDAESGTYTVVARFHWSVRPFQDVHQLERTVTVRWKVEDEDG